MNSIEQLLIEQSYSYLEAFLIEDKSFYPFAMLMDKNMKAVPLEPDIEDEFPSSEHLIKLFERGIKKEVLKKNSIYVLGIICIDVYINTNKSGVEFRLITLTEEKKFYLMYIINQNKVVWLKP